MENITSQNKGILAYLQSGKSITPLEALKEFGCFRLKEQSERLLALGLKKETADMMYCKTSYGESISVKDDDYLEHLDFPAWSLHRLIVLSGMGIIETTTDNIYDKVIAYIAYRIKWGSFNKEYLEKWV